MKKTIVLGLFLLSVSCVTQKLPEDETSGSAISTAGDASPTPTFSPTPIPSSTVMEATMAPRLVRVMNYNQYNMTLSKLTGINQSKVSVLFEQLKGSLPGDTNIQAMTSFNLVAITRLADFYCGLYINGERDAAGVLVPGGIPMLSENFTSSDDAIKNHLLNKFLDYEATDTAYESLSAELDNILNNSDGQGSTLVSATNLNAAQMNRNLSVIACVAILASSHITLLQ